MMNQKELTKKIRFWNNREIDLIKSILDPSKDQFLKEINVSCLKNARAIRKACEAELKIMKNNETKVVRVIDPYCEFRCNLASCEGCKRSKLEPSSQH